MLRELRVQNFAVVEEVTLEFGPGLSVLSGETGAGKSILFEALALLIGGRPSQDMIRSGAGWARIEGRFEVEGLDGVTSLCDRAGVDHDDGWLILRRELRREGRHRAWANGSPSTTTLLREFGLQLLELHGQHDHQRLLDRKHQLRILDAFGRHEGRVAETSEAFDRVRTLDSRLEALRRLAREGRERADYLRFKCDEIAAAALLPDEDEALETEARRLTHSEELIELSGSLHQRMYEAEGSIVDQLGELGGQLDALIAIDDASSPFRDLYEAALRNVEELGRSLAPYRDAIEHDPRRLDDIRARQDLLYRLKRKYGDSLAEVIDAGEEARRELQQLSGAGDEITRLESAREAAAAELAQLASDLSDRRRAAAAALSEAVTRALPELGMRAGRLEVQLNEHKAIRRTGAERADFLVSLNPGFPPAPLRRVASGGEMSRLMLALETALIEVDELPILVFDEIDVGIGGEVAHRVADRLVRLSAAHQILVVTHLAQIAARADAHYSVGKVSDTGEARTSVQALTGSERVQEVARMLGGDPASRASRAHAEELLAGQL
ncbi:DNA repair protein RecN [Candidatus Palauibacter sp.]|uniref:DNA repair protein RecN n=1 Tax=Candidatus Palauibacter sp. TaxID=3101350 RepID=UPI003B5BF1A4